MQNLYFRIDDAQKIWYEKSGFTCVKSCGECCRNFEPDLLECEALYMAAWLLENQKEVADDIMDGKFPFPENTGCPFWNEHNDYHCTIYGGRPFICRFFGGCGSTDKEKKTVFKPCKFYPTEILIVVTAFRGCHYSKKDKTILFQNAPVRFNNVMFPPVKITD